MEINITSRDKDRIKKFKKLFGMIVRVFYESMDIAIMDSALKIFFENFYFETEQLQELTALPIKKVRKTLIALQDAQIIKTIEEYQLFDERKYVKDVVDKLYTPDEQKNTKFWELNHNIKQVLYNRLKTIEKQMEIDFKDFDLYTKICSNPYCKKEFKSEEYFSLKDLCSTCGDKLELKHQVEEETSKKIIDREGALNLINFFCTYLEEIEKIKFPDYMSLKLNSEEVFGIENDENKEELKKEEELSDIDERLADLIDYDLRFVKFTKDFFFGKKIDVVQRKARFGDTLKNVTKNTSEFFRAQDLKKCFLKAFEYDEKFEEVEKIKLEKRKLNKLSDIEYKKVYIKKMKNKIFK